MSDPSILLEVLNDKNGKLLFKAISEGNTERLQALIDHKANIESYQDDLNCLQFAAVHQQWKCVRILIDAQSGRIGTNRNYRAGLVLLLAAQANQQDIVEALFAKFYFRYTKVHQNKNTKYTALHWAVYHNNLALCSLLVKHIKTDFGGHKIVRAKDNQGFNALDLALELDRFDCAREIAKTMSILYVINRASDDILFKIVLNDIRFGFDYFSGYGIKNLFYKDFVEDGLINKKISLILNHIFSLPEEEKKKTIEIALNPNSAFGKLIENIYSKTKREKYHRALAIELQKINQTEENINITQRLDKRLSFSEVVPIYINTTDLFARLPQVPSNALLTEPLPEKDEPITYNVPLMI